VEISGISVIEPLKFLESIGAYSDGVNYLVGRWGTWFPGFDNSVGSVLPPDFGELRVRAFMKIMGRLGLVDGCHCGCRGDYMLTEKGKELIAGEEE